MLKKVFKLNDFEIPMIGIGTKELIGQPCKKIISLGMGLGYRLIDTNPHFKNEIMISEGFKRFQREKFFIMSKIPTQHMDYNEAKLSVEKSLKNMKLEYLDLVMIESPGKSGIKGASFKNKSYRHRTWKALIELKKDGLIKNIGVSNYLPSHIDEMWDKYEFNPVANQIEFHPFCFNLENYQYYKEKNIQIIASSPLAKANSKLWHDEKFVELKKELKLKKCQILLKWALQKGAVVIPKTRIPHHLK